MSHDATNWAVKVRGISCTEARVLWHLADCHNPVFGCYPKQDYLSIACEIDERSVRRALVSLRGKGLVNWVEAREGKNRKANRYSLAFEEGFRAHEDGEKGENEPDKLSGSSPASTGQNCLHEPDSGGVLNRTPESSIEPVREPVKGTGNEREGARAQDFDREDDPKRLRERFRVLEIGKHGNPWPLLLKSSRDWAFRKFLDLSPEERERAESRRDAFLAACPKVKSGERKGQPDAPVLGVYLRDRHFDLLDAIAPQAVAKVEHAARTIDVPPFGPVWGGLRYWRFVNGPIAVDIPLDLRDRVTASFETLRRNGESIATSFLRRKRITLAADGTLIFPEGFERDEQRRRTIEAGYPEVNRLHDQAKARARGMEDARYAVLGDLCEAVPVDGAMFTRWEALDEQRGWPGVPDPGHQRVVYFPRGGPEGLAEFERAARALLAGTGVEDRGDEHAA